MGHDSRVRFYGNHTFTGRYNINVQKRQSDEGEHVTEHRGRFGGSLVDCRYAYVTNGIVERVK